MWTAERIKALRRRHGEKQEDFCSRLGVTVWALRDWEQGRSLPSGPAALLLDRVAEDFENNQVRQLQIA